jgi:hypothetical protein
MWMGIPADFVLDGLSLSKKGSSHCPEFPLKCVEQIWMTPEEATNRRRH